MATIPFTTEVIGTNGNKDVLMVTWPLLTVANPVGEAFEMPAFADRSLQIYGTYTAAANLRIEGSNKPKTGSPLAAPTADADYVVLADPQGTDLDIVTADKQIEQVLEVTRWIRPRISSGGDGSTSLNVILLLRKK